jgi:hypothetical protein
MKELLGFELPPIASEPEPQTPLPFEPATPETDGTVH